jgi:hypothetical protein
MKRMNNFNQDLDFSHSMSDKPWWEKVYKKAFVDFSVMHNVRDDGWAQRGGIDRQVILKGGKVINIDEKVRRDDYGDIILEYWSNEEQKVPGWIAKDLACDFIAYAIEPSQKCYLLPFPVLRVVWRDNRGDWVNKALANVAGFKIVRAKNPNYTTVSLAVKTDILLSSIRDAMVITWENDAPAQEEEQC